MRLRDTTETPPVRRMTVARGRLELQFHGPLPEAARLAAGAAALAATKEAYRMVPTAAFAQVTDCFTDVDEDPGHITATVTIQGYARESLESMAMLAAAAALVAVRDALAEAGASGRIAGIEIVQSVVG